MKRVEEVMNNEPYSQPSIQISIWSLVIIATVEVAIKAFDVTLHCHPTCFIFQFYFHPKPIVFFFFK